MSPFLFGKRPLRTMLSAAALLGLTLAGHAEDARLKLVIGSQDAAVPAIVKASGVLEGTPYDVQWAVLPGPAAQLSGLYSKALDVGLMGDTSLIIEQGKSKFDWTEANAPLQIVAGWRQFDANYPAIVTVVHSDAGINTLADLRGKKWSYNFGGFNYLQYVLSRIKAGLKTTDIEPVQLGDGNAAAAAFNSGQVDVYSGSLGPVKISIDKGAARVLITSDELGIPALTVFTARGDVIRDPAKNAALADFLSRLSKQWAWYAQNVDKVEAIYRSEIKQTEARAKFSAAAGKATFQPLDDALVAKEQKIADTLLASGDLSKPIKVDVEFARSFNAATQAPSQ